VIRKNLNPLCQSAQYFRRILEDLANSGLGERKEQHAFMRRDVATLNCSPSSPQGCGCLARSWAAKD